MISDDRRDVDDDDDDDDDVFLMAPVSTSDNYAHGAGETVKVGWSQARRGERRSIGHDAWPVSHRRLPSQSLLRCRLFISAREEIKPRGLVYLIKAPCTLLHP